MPRYLSDQWIAELDEAARSHAGLADATRSIALVIEQVVERLNEQAPDPSTDTSSRAQTGTSSSAPTGTSTGVPSGSAEVRWHVVIDHGTVRFVAGPATDPTVRFTTDEATARAISTGAATAQGAFMHGRLRVGGDTGALIAHHDVLAGLGDVFAAVPIDD